MACATALLEEGGGGPGDKPPEPIGGGDDAGQCADGAETHGAKHDQGGRVSTHDAAHSCTSRCPLTPFASL
jgi:hypothetical protein